MEPIIVAAILFLTGYLINVFYITVFYHRGLTHRALILDPRLERFVALTGPWVTGIDPKGWACMHRLHHLHSDTAEDPHSPLFQGVLGVAMGQLRSYENMLRGLLRKQEPFVSVVKDLPFNVSILNRKKLWPLPYLVHLTIAILLSFAFHHPIVGVAYFLGMMSHPVQGWMVNALAHRYGYRNFDIKDNSKNNLAVAWLVVGEGFQNNHHANPRSANFAVGRREVDLGYFLCYLPIWLGLAHFPEPRLEPTETRLPAAV